MRGFVLIPVLIFIFSTIVVGGVVATTKIIQIDKKIKEREVQLATELGQLAEVKKSDANLKEKTENYSKLGVELPEIRTAAAQIRNLISTKNFTKAQALLLKLDKRLEEALAEKKEIERKATLEVRDKLEAKVVDFQRRGVNVAEVDGQLPEVRGDINSGEFAKAREQMGLLSKRLDKLLTAKLELERKEQERRLAAQATVSQNVSGVNYSQKTVSTSRGNFTVDVLTVNLAQIQVGI